jgi:glycosyltransferase involved in cell wall biosynthesis
MIKILFGIWRMRAGGGEKLLAYQLKDINKSKFDPWLVTLTKGDRENPFSDVYELPAGHEVKFNFKGIKDIPSLNQLVKFLKQEKFDVLVTSLFNANLVLRLAAKRAGIPTIIIYEHNIYTDKKKWQIKVDKFLSKNTDTILVDADLVADFTAKQEGIPRDKFRTMYIPPLMEAATESKQEIRKELGIDNAHPVVLSVARMVEEKGRIYLVRAAAEVLKKHSKLNFVLVGDGPKLEVLKQEAEKLGINDKVIFPGFYDIAKALKVCDIFVDNSLRVDVPIALMEAMQAGKSIVVSRVGEMHKFILHGESGLSVEPGDAQGLAEAITKLLDNPGLAQRCGQAAQDLAAKYSMDSYMREFEKLVVEHHNNKR